MTEEQARKLKAIFDTGEYLILLSDPDWHDQPELTQDIDHSLRYESGGCEGNLIELPIDGVRVAKIIKDWEGI